MLELYKKYHSQKDCTLIGLFREIKKKFNPKRILYPGSYVHITPSLIFSDVTYVDSFKDTHLFYKSLAVREFIKENKEYNKEVKIKFYEQDYFKELPEELESFDIVISQYSGFVGQAVKKYLKKGGLLVCNNSHGDASMASIDLDYKLTAVYDRKSDDKFNIYDEKLNEYLVPKKDVKVTKALLEKTMKGIVYTKCPSGYIFRKRVTVPY